MSSTVTPRPGFWLALPLSLLVLTACSSESGTDSAKANTSETRQGKHVGVVKTSQGDYRFTPTNCLLQQVDGDYDIEIQGPGQAPDGETIFVQLSSTGNELRVSLGVDTPFKTTERSLTAGHYTSETFSIQVTDNSLTIPQLVLNNQAGDTVDRTASLKIDCNG